MSKSMPTISYEAFEHVDLRSGTITKVESFPRARKPAFKIWADFGEEIGELQTSAQVTRCAPWRLKAEAHSPR